MLPVLIKRAELLNEAADRDFDDNGILNFALIEVRVADSEIPLGVERISDCFQDS
ncbi:hypothetical protein D9M71_788290 [compost metagenome]